MTDADMAIYMAACLSFQAGNACRPDVCDNLTHSEFLSWSREFEVMQSEENSVDGVPDLRVSS